MTAPAGGKTGTMDDYMDALFVGFTPAYTMGVWVGFDAKQTLGRDMTGSAAALPVWIKVMNTALEGMTFEPFELPDGLVWKEVCRDSGLLAVPACEDTYREVFLEDHEPVETCPLHGGSGKLDLWDDSSFDALDRRGRDGALQELEDRDG